MTRASLFNNPLLLGFDQFERMVERLSKGANEGYPPYNVELVSETRLRITLAVAGFESDELSVTVEDNQLVIRGRKDADDSARTFLHRGIATRQFERTFVLAEGIEVSGAKLENGLLNIELDRPLQESRSRRIEIDNRGESAQSLPKTGTPKATKAS